MAEVCFDKKHRVYIEGWPYRCLWWEPK